MDWGEFKTRMEQQGVTDDMQLLIKGFLGLQYPMDIGVTIMNVNGQNRQLAAMLAIQVNPTAVDVSPIEV